MQLGFVGSQTSSLKFFFCFPDALLKAEPEIQTLNVGVQCFCCSIEGILKLKDLSRVYIECCLGQKYGMQRKHLDCCLSFKFAEEEYFKRD